MDSNDPKELKPSGSWKKAKAIVGEEQDKKKSGLLASLSTYGGAAADASKRKLKALEAQLQDERSSHKQELSGYKSQIKKLSGQVQSLEDQLLDKSEKLKKVKNLKEEVKHARAEARAEAERMGERAAELNTVAKSIEDQSRQAEGDREERARLEGLVSTCSKELKQVDASLGSLQMLLLTLKAGPSSTKGTSFVESDDSEDMTANDSQVASFVEGQVAEKARTMLNAVSQEMGAMQQGMETAQKQVLSSSEQLSRVLTERDHLIAQLEDVRKELKEANLELTRSQSRENSGQTELAAAYASLQSTQGALAQAEAKVAALSQQQTQDALKARLSINLEPAQLSQPPQPPQPGRQAASRASSRKGTRSGMTSRGSSLQTSMEGSPSTSRPGSALRKPPSRKDDQSQAKLAELTLLLQKAEVQSNERLRALEKNKEELKFLQSTSHVRVLNPAERKKFAMLCNTLQSHLQTGGMLPTLKTPAEGPTRSLNPLSSLLKFRIELLVNGLATHPLQLEPTAMNGIYTAAVHYFTMDSEKGEVVFGQGSAAPPGTHSSNMLMDLVIRPTVDTEPYIIRAGDTLGVVIRLHQAAEDGKEREREVVYNGNVLSANEVITAVDMNRPPSHFSIWPDLSSSWRWEYSPKGWKLTRLRWRLLLKKVVAPEISNIMQMLVCTSCSNHKITDHQR
eukprot:gene383-715_t